MNDAPEQRPDPNGRTMGEAERKFTRRFKDNSGPIAAVTATVFLLVGVARAAPGTSSIVWFIVALILVVIAAFVQRIIKLTNIRTKDRLMQACFYTILVTIVASGIFMILGVVLSLFFGWPLELRSYMNSGLVVRRELNSDEYIALEPSWGTDFLTKEAKENKRTSKWFEWMRDGATVFDSDAVFVAYTSSTQINYLKPFRAQLHFGDFGAVDTSVSHPPVARLAEGAAFTINKNPLTGEISFRQVELVIDLGNMDEGLPDKCLKHEFPKLSVDLGDKIIILLKFIPFGEGPIKEDLDSFLASIVHY